MRIHFLCTLAFFPFLLLAQPIPLHKLNAAQLDQQIAQDLRSTETYRAGLAGTVAYAKQRSDLFRVENLVKRVWREEEKAVVRTLWRRHLDYQIALESIEQRYRGFWRIAATPMRERAFTLLHAAHLTRYRHALDILEPLTVDAEIAKFLNEHDAAFGVPVNAFDRFKFAFLNVAEGGQFAALSAFAQTISYAPPAKIAEALTQDRDRLLQMGRSKGAAMTAANALSVLKDLGAKAVFPAQAGISDWMGDTRLTPVRASLISKAQIADIQSRLQPGDVMLQRREWFVSNVGLPGFWSHAALYIGTPAERRAFFDDAEVRAWVKSQGEASGEFELLAASKFPKAARAASVIAADGHAARVLEAISEGVSFTSIEHSAAADSLVALRPRLSKAERAQAILRAFGYAGRPYDFDFDFQTDTALVCTELIYKSYEPATGFQGLRMTPTEMVGRLAIPANDIARAFDAEAGTPNAQWDMVIFLDGIGRGRTARVSTEAEFRKSWLRPKWHILLADTAKP